ncbi:MAG TPA: sterol desaturase family protein [Cellvibrio sp.]|nr:sterol desaturase family protein [Cellvibrio sp.]
MFIELAVLIGLGFFMQGISLLLRPARNSGQKTDVIWDLIGAISPRFFFIVIAAAIATPLQGWLSSYAWIVSTREFIMGMPFLLLVFVYIVLVDLLDYWMHRALHTTWFWHQHAWHHAPTVIYWLSGLRTSPGQIIIRIIPSTIFAAFISFEQFVNLGIFFLVFFVLSQHFIHSNMRIPFEPYIELLLVTPRYHMVHHSVERKYSDTNFAQIFVWDRLFGTYTDPATVPEDAPSGLNYDNTNLRLLFGFPPPKSSKARVENTNEENVNIAG